MSSSLDEKTQFKIDWRKILILYNFRIHCDSIYFVFNDPDPVPQNCFELSNYISSLELPEHLVTNSFQSGKCCLAFNLYMLFIHKTSNFHKGLDFLSFPSSWVCVCVCVCARAQSCPTLCNPMDCSPPGSSVHWIHQTRILERAAKPSCRGPSQPRDRTCFSSGFCIAGRFFATELLGKPSLVPRIYLVD